MADPIVKTSRELSRNTASVLEEIAQAGQPALITHHGRFVAVLMPLKPGEVESQALGAMAREIGERYRSEKEGGQ
jgi:prevent-host-death family protein